MLKFPMPFKVGSQSVSGIQTSWTTKSPIHSLEVPVSIPPEFEGPGNGLSPEDLFAMALQNCFIATFKVFAEKSKLSFSNIQVEGILEVDRDENSRPWMARMHLKVQLNGVDQVENAKRLLEKTSQSCMILNSVRTTKTFDFLINS